MRNCNVHNQCTRNSAVTNSDTVRVSHSVKYIPNVKHFAFDCGDIISVVPEKQIPLNVLCAKLNT